MLPPCPVLKLSRSVRASLLRTSPSTILSGRILSACLRRSSNVTRDSSVYVSFWHSRSETVEKCSRFLAAHLAKYDPVWPHSQRVFEKIVERDARFFGVRVVLALPIGNCREVFALPCCAPRQVRSCLAAFSARV